MKLGFRNSNIKLSKDIAKYLGVDLLKATIKKFPDKEIFVEIQENVRRRGCLCCTVYLLPCK